MILLRLVILKICRYPQSIATNVTIVTVDKKYPPKVSLALQKRRIEKGILYEKR